MTYEADDPRCYHVFGPDKRRGGDELLCSDSIFLRLQADNQGGGQSMQDYQQILVGTDFSNASMAAASRGADLARRYGARLILVHVIEHFPEDMPNDPIVPENLDPATFYHERAQQKLADLAEKIGNKNVVQEVITSTASARHEIRLFAEKQGIDLIILGSHGSGLLHAFGSTTMGVTYDVPCDVMVVRSAE